ncbi:MAG: L-threonylcarbamoyladenylate synthase [Terracidiphilus sp.]
MKTLRLTVDAARIGAAESVEALDRAAAILRGGGLVALPTETVYGLGANAFDPAAVARIFAAKERPAWDPVIVHIAGPDKGAAMLGQLVSEVPEAALPLVQRLIGAFWPGPLTLLLPRSAAVPDAVTAGRPLVGVRTPAHPVALELIRRAQVPVAAPSANRFGRVSPTTAEHVLEDLDGRIDAVLDAGPTVHGVESTVLDPCQSPMILYRQGAVTVGQIQEIAGAVEVFRGGETLERTPKEALPSPGVGLRHYAPRAKLVLVGAPLEELGRRLAETTRDFANERVGIMLPSEVAIPHTKAKIYRWGRWAALEELAHNLYAGLHELDAQGCTVILCPVPPAEGIGAAIRDRLTKAAQPPAAGLPADQIGQ